MLFHSWESKGIQFACYFIENSERLSYYVTFIFIKIVKWNGVACKVTYQLALMLRLDMVWFSSLVQPLWAQILLPCYNSRWKLEVPLPNESSYY